MHQPTGPEWRARLRACRTCHAHSLVHVEDGVAAFPLLHEEGSLGARVLFVMEAPNFDDSYDHAKHRITVDPRTDPSGAFFHERLTGDLGLKVEDVLVTNSVLCLPARKNDKHKVVARQRNACAVNLRGTIEAVAPRVVVTLGAEALKAISAVERHDLVFGRDIATPHRWFGRLLFPLAHPSRLGRMSRRDSLQVADYQTLRKAIEQALVPAGAEIRA